MLILFEDVIVILTILLYDIVATIQNTVYTIHWIYSRYAIQQYEGRVTFKGPAFPERDQPGMSMGGGLWPSRYVNYCGNLLEDFEEDEVRNFMRHLQL